MAKYAKHIKQLKLLNSPIPHSLSSDVASSSVSNNNKNNKNKSSSSSKLDINLKFNNILKFKKIYGGKGILKLISSSSTPEEPHQKISNKNEEDKNENEGSENYRDLLGLLPTCACGKSSQCGSRNCSCIPTTCITPSNQDKNNPNNPNHPNHPSQKPSGNQSSEGSKDTRERGVRNDAGLVYMTTYERIEVCPIYPDLTLILLITLRALITLEYRCI